MKIGLLIIQFIFVLSANALVLNKPFPQEPKDERIAHRSIVSFPTTLDPQEVYDNQNIFLIRQVYEQLYNINYLNKKIKITPYLASELPKITFLDKRGKVIGSKKSNEIAFTVYHIPIKKNIYYQPHPAFCKTESLKDCIGVKRALVSEDFVYSFQRTANKKINSPIVSLLSKYIWGYNDFLHGKSQNIQGVRAIDRYTLEIITEGYYAQFIYWLGMPLLAPIAHEVDEYYLNRDNKEVWRWFTAGTGPFMLFNDKGYQKLSFIKNPHFRKEIINEKTLEDENYQKHIGQQVPLIDKIEFYLEKESIPRWNKFLQSYYDLSSIPSETFEKVVWLGPDGRERISPQLEKQNIILKSKETYSLNGLSFNMLDKRLGNNRYLRQAISIAINYLEYINIFQNAFVQQSQGPVPQILLESENIDGFNPYIFTRFGKHFIRKNLTEAKRLLAKAGYPNGIDPNTHKPLVLILDVESSGSPYDKAIFNWYRKKFKTLGITLEIRENDKNRLNYLLEKGLYQMTLHGWAADYPDTENFFMLFYSKNSKKKLFGPNISNYNNPQYDKLFEKLSSPLSENEKKALEIQLYQILIRDCVWAWGINSQLIYLHYNWLESTLDTSPFLSGNSKYYALDTAKRSKSWILLNQAEFKPLIIIILSVLLLILPFWWEMVKFNRSKAKRTIF